MIDADLADTRARGGMIDAELAITRMRRGVIDAGLADTRARRGVAETCLDFCAGHVASINTRRAFIHVACLRRTTPAWRYDDARMQIPPRAKPVQEGV